jgi:hypothetical protein
MATLDEIIQRNLNAVGGAAATGRIRTIKLRFRITEENFVLNAVYLADHAGRMRIDVFSNEERVYTEGFDGKQAWALRKGMVEGEVEGSQAAAALRHGVELPGKIFWLHQMIERGSRIRFAGNATLDGKSYHVLNVTLFDGFSLHFFLNAQTYLIERIRDERAMHPDVNSQIVRIESVFSDFRRDAGVIRAFREEQFDLTSGTLLSGDGGEFSRNDVAIPQDLFSLPRPKS